MGRVSAAFGRLSKRERVLVSVMLGMVALLVVFLLNLWLGSGVANLRANVDKEQRSLETMYAKATDFVAVRQQGEARRAQAVQNAKLNITERIANIAEQVSFESIDPRGNPSGRKKLAEFLDYAPPKDSPLARKRKTSSRDKEKHDPLDGYYRRDVEVTVRDNTTFDAIYELMEKIEEARDLLFVTEIRLDRDKRRADRAGRGKVVVSTYYYEEKKDE